MSTAGEVLPSCDTDRGSEQRVELSDPRQCLWLIKIQSHPITNNLPALGPNRNGTLRAELSPSVTLT